MPEKEQLSLDSLKELTEHIADSRQETSQEDAKDDATPSEEPQNVLAPLTDLTSSDTPALEEYHEFPRLDKNKTYDLDLIKKSVGLPPQRKTFLNSSISNLKILLQDSELFEAYLNSGNLRPIQLKNSHAIFNGLSDCDSLVFSQNQIGSFSVNVSKGDESEEINLGCIVKFEYVREEYSNLILSSRDIDGDIAVVGAPCSIEFIFTDNQDIPQAEAASVERLKGARDEVIQENQKAGSYSWDLKN